MGMGELCFLYFLAVGVLYSRSAHGQNMGIQLDCSPGWDLLDGSCVKVFTTESTWKKGEEICSSVGGHLLKLVDFQMTQYAGNLSLSQGIETFWIGMRISPSGQVTWSDNTDGSVMAGFWTQLEPGAHTGCVFVSPSSLHGGSYLWSITTCDHYQPFICQRKACPKDYFHCVHDGCIPERWVCDGSNDCGDHSDETNCPGLCSYLQHGSSGLIDPTNQTGPVCHWAIETPLGTNIQLNVSSISAGFPPAELLIFYGGRSESSSHFMRKVKANSIPLPITLFIGSNLMVVTFHRPGDSMLQAEWKSVIAVEGMTSPYMYNLEADETIQSATVAAHHLADQVFIWKLSAKSLQQLVTVMFNGMRLEEGDRLTIRDGITMMSPIILENPGDSPQPEYITSTGNSILVEIVTASYSSSRNLHFSYQQGCNVTLTNEFGVITSPGNLKERYPNYVNCVYNLRLFPRLANDTPISLYLDVVDIEDRDMLMLTTGFQMIDLTNQPKSLEMQTNSEIKLITNYLNTSTGFQIMYSPGCPTPWFNFQTVFTPMFNSHYRSILSISCEVGYEFPVEMYGVGVDSIGMECLYGGKWNVTVIPQCQPVYCGFPPVVMNGYIEERSGVIYRAEVIYSCFDGYSLTASANIQCQADGMWSDPPTCQASRCPALPMIEFGSVDGTDTSYSTILTYSCVEGYQIIGANRLLCQSDNTWSDEPPTCNRVECGIPTPPPNGQLSISTGVFYNDTLIITCDAGYFISGPSIITCLFNQTYSTGGQCEDINECIRQNDCSGVAICHNTPGSYICTCPKGFELAPNQTHCLDIDECDMDPGCSDFCLNLPGTYMCDCPEGYHLFREGDTEGLQLAPGETGLKKGDVLYYNHTCVKVKCPTPDLPMNAIQLTDKGTYRLGDELRYLCKIGYQNTSGETTLRCESTRQWSAAPPTCSEAMCEEEDMPSHLQNPAAVSPKGPVPYLGRVNLTCVIPGRPEPVIKSRICLYDQMQNTYRFFGDDFECGFIDCGEPGPVFGGQVQLLNNSTRFNATLKVTCLPLFSLSGESCLGSHIVPCLDSGHWGFNNIRCLGDTCMDPGRPADAVLLASSFQQGSQVNYRCLREGYELSDSDPLQCEVGSDGTTLIWNKPVPTCNDIMPPEFAECPEDKEINQFDIAGLVVPVPEDNSGLVKSFTVSPSWFDPNLPISKSMEVLYTTIDSVGLNTTCLVKIHVRATELPSIQCPEPVDVVYPNKDEDRIQMRIDETLVVRSGGVISLSPSHLNQTYIGQTIIVRATVTDNYQRSQSCSFQLTLHESRCNENQIGKPVNGIKTCLQGMNTTMSCAWMCNPGYTFYEDLMGSQISTTCQENSLSTPVWSRIRVPECVANTERAVGRNGFTITYQSSEDLTGTCLQIQQTQLTQDLTHNFNIIKDTCDQLMLGQCAGQDVSIDLQFAEESAVQNNTKVIFMYSVEHIPKTGCLARIRICGRLISPTFIAVLPPILPQIENCTELMAGNLTSSFDFICNMSQKTREENGTPVCLNCPPGTFVSDRMMCQNCPMGTYQFNEGASDCIKCPENTTTISMGNTEQISCLELCPPGWYSDSGLPPCSQCPQNTYWENSTSCLSCPAGEKTLATGSPSVESCLAICPTGKFSGNQGVAPCESCPKGFYQDKEGSVTCEECPDDLTTVTMGSTSMNQCVNTSSLCMNVNCLHGGSCMAENRYALCICLEGYTGSMCETMIDHCLSHPCYYENECIPHLNGYECNCTQPGSSCVKGPLILERYSHPPTLNIDHVVYPIGFNLSLPVLYNTSLIYVNSDGELCDLTLIVPESFPLNLSCPDNIVLPLSDGEEIPSPGSIPVLDRIQGAEGAVLDVIYDPKWTDFGNYRASPVYVSATYREWTVSCEFQMLLQAENCSVSRIVPVVNGEKTCGVFEGVSYCTFTCNPGYMFEDGLVEKNITCSSVAGWPPLPQYCIQVANLSESIQIFDLSYTVEDSSAFPQTCLESLKRRVEPCVNNAALKGIQSGQCTIKHENLIYIIDHFKVTVGLTITPTIAGQTCFQVPSNNFSIIWESVCGSQLNLNESGFNCPLLNYVSSMMLPEKCDIGYITKNSQCVPCPPGSFFFNRKCIPCPVDSYNDQQALVGTCTSCSNNKKTVNEGSVHENQCIRICPGGFFSTTGYQPCDPCPKDHVSLNHTYCKPCSSHQGTWDIGPQSICTDKCSQGWFSYTGLVPCQPCPPGFFQDAMGSQMCKACPSNTTTTMTGAVDSSFCQSTEILFCKTGDCQNGGSCELVGQGYSCLCPPGYAGVHCQIEELFYGANCGMERNDCDVSYCLNGGMCQDLPLNKTCLCQAGYSGERCEKRVSMCVQQPCENSGTCEDLGIRRICHCPAGFTGLNCEENIDDCASGPCLFGGDCVDGVGTFTCNCTSGYTGNRCDVRLDRCVTNTCGSGGRCVDHYILDKYQCVCEDGFEADVNDMKCKEINSCLIDPCVKGDCGDIGEALFVCACDPTSYGSLCQHDVDDCRMYPCLNNATCQDGVDDFTCHCQSGFTGELCETNINDCQEACVSENSDGCADLIDDFYCMCKQGFTGKNCSIELNECDSVPCEHGGTCEDMVNGSVCICPTGWEGDHCERSVNMCQSNPCFNQGQCVPIFNNYLCKCMGNNTFGGQCEYAPLGCDSIQPCLNRGECQDNNSSIPTCKCPRQPETVCSYLSSRNMSNTGSGTTKHGVFLPTECKKLCDTDSVCLGFGFNHTSMLCVHFDSLGSDFPYPDCEYHMKGRCEEPLIAYSGRGCEIISNPYMTEICENGGTPRQTVYSGISCLCPLGYSGVFCENNLDDCAGLSCSGTCVDGENMAYCRCPPGFTGNNCQQAVDVDYDLYFYSRSYTGQASLPYPIRLNLMSFTVSLWIRFAMSTPATFFMGFSVPSAYSLREKSEVLRIDVEGVTLRLLDKTERLMFEEFLDVTDGKWHQILLISDYQAISGEVKLRLVADSITMNQKTITGLSHTSLHTFVWFTLGNLYQPEHGPEEGGGLNGYISQVTVYNRPLDFSTDILVIGRNSTGFLPGSVLRWDEFELFPGVERTVSSSVTVSENECSSAFSNQDCDLSERGLPVFKSCPEYLDYYSMEPVSEVIWDPPQPSQYTSLNTNYRSGASFLWGRYLIIYEARNTQGDVSICSFILHVKNDNCSNTIGPDRGDIMRSMSTRYTNLKLSCDQNYVVSQITPDFYTCGPSGNIDPRPPANFMPYRLPACGRSVSRASTRLTLILRYTLADCSNPAREGVESDIRKNLQKLHQETDPGLCPTSDCMAGVRILVTCVDEGKKRRRRQVMQDEMRAEIAIDGVRSSVLWNGEMVPPTVPIETDITSFLTPDRAVNLALDETNYEITMEEFCPEPQVLIGNDCVTCGQGYVHENGMCESCPIGQYRSDSEDSCTECPGGNTTIATGTPSVSGCKDSCNKGKKYSESLGSCTPCSLGFYQPEEGLFDCLPCPLGKTTPQEGTETIDQCFDVCAGGEELKSYGTCEPCKIGTYRPDGDSSPTCLSCPTGNVTSSTGSTHISQCDTVDCPSGTKISGLWCEACVEGSFQPNRSQPSCLPCEPGYSTRDTRATQPQDCQAFCLSGFQRMGDNCTECPRGWYKDNSKGLFGECVLCPVEFITESTAATSINNCTVGNCSAGYYLTMDNLCSPCPLRTYQPNRWSDHCQDCPMHFTTPNNGSSEVTECNIFSCLPGYTDINGSCIPCEIGFYKSEYGDGECVKCNGFFRTQNVAATSSNDCNIVACPAGWFDNSGHCEQCVYGQYQPDQWQDSCQPCLPGFTTLTQGATQLSQCVQKCDAGSEYISVWKNCSRCSRGYYRGEYDMPQDECVLCPSGWVTPFEGATNSTQCTIGNCSAGTFWNMTVNQCESCRKGFFQPAIWMSDCIPCGPDLTTVGAGTVSPEDCLAACDPGYGGRGGVCEICPRGTYKEGDLPGVCTPCTGAFTTPGEGTTNKADCNQVACPVGLKRNVVKNQCEKCGYGEYQDEEWMDSCKPCPQDKRATLQMGSSSLTQCVLLCPSGSFYSMFMRCEICPIGSYRNQSDLSQVTCTMCSNGLITPVQFDFANSEESCIHANCTVPGTYRNAETNTCDNCPIGTYQNKKWSESCEECGPGFTTRNVGSTQNTDCVQYCPSGQHLVDGRCKSCPRGFYKNNAEDIFGGCVMCNEGFITAADSAVSALDCIQRNCSAGYFRDVHVQPSGQEICEECPRGTYQPEKWQTMCRDCPAGFSTETTGATHSDQCQLLCDPGNILTTTGCSLCPRGTYSAGGVSNSCIPCDVGLTTPNIGAKDKSECSQEACDPGEFSSSANRCELCPLGEYQPNSLASSCLKCDSGRTTLAEGSITPESCVESCPAGSSYVLSSQICVLCERGTYRSAGSPQSSCTQCPPAFITETTGSTNSLSCSIANCSQPGTYHNAETKVCEPCPVGSIQTEKWQDNCDPCPSGFTTANTGAITCIHVCDTDGYCENGAVCQKDSLPHCKCDSAYKGDRCESRVSAELLGGNQTVVIIGSVVGAVMFIILVVLIIMSVCVYQRRQNRRISKKSESASIMGAPRLVTNPYFYGENSMAGSIEMNRSYLRLGHDDNVEQNFLGFENPGLNLPSEPGDAAVYNPGSDDAVRL